MSYEKARSSAAGDSFLLLFAKAEPPLISVPMVPLVHEGLVDLLEKGQAARKSSANVGFGDVVPALDDALGDSFHGEVSGGHFDEVKQDKVPSGLPSADPTRIHPG